MSLLDIFHGKRFEDGESYSHSRKKGGWLLSLNECLQEKQNIALFWMRHTSPPFLLRKENGIFPWLSNRKIKRRTKWTRCWDHKGSKDSLGTQEWILRLKIVQHKERVFTYKKEYTLTWKDFKATIKILKGATLENFM